MLKYLFKPYYSVFECVWLMYAVMMFSATIIVSLWLGILLLFVMAIVGTAIQIAMTNKIAKQESMEKELEQ